MIVARYGEDSAHDQTQSIPDQPIIGCIPLRNLVAERFVGYLDHHSRRHPEFLITDAARFVGNKLRCAISRQQSRPPY